MSMYPRVLLIEDEAGLRLTLSDRLGSEGYAVETASDGEAGLARATSGGYDLIVLDLMLPRMNKGGLFVAHNVVNKKSEMGDFLDAIWKTPALYTTIVSPSSEGMSVSVKR